MGLRLTFFLLIGLRSVLFPTSPGPDRSRLIQAVQARDWNVVRALTLDDSFRVLQERFGSCLALSLAAEGENRFVYHARFSSHGEIGSFSFEPKGALYSTFQINSRVSSYACIGEYTRFPVEGVRIGFGDAELLLRKGTLYRGNPMQSLHLFEGECEFSIRPANSEEELTLRELTGEDRFHLRPRRMLILLDQSRLNLKGEGRRMAADALPHQVRETLPLLEREWGVEIASLGERWFPHFGESLQALFMPLEESREYYRYIHDSSQVPDTSLVKKPQNIFYLYYNSQLGLKLAAGMEDGIESLRIKMRFNPEYAFLSGGSVISFRQESEIRSWFLDGSLGLKVHGLSPESLFIRQRDECRLMGENRKELQISYAGKLKGKEYQQLLARERASGFGGQVNDRFIELGSGELWYPSDGTQGFFRCSLTVSVPEHLNCLAPGVLQSKTSRSGFTCSTFESPACKSLVLVCGDFVRLDTVPGRIPLHFYGRKSLNPRKYLKTEEVRRIVDFLSQKFGALEIPELNILLIRGEDYGGRSTPGLILFHLVENELEIKESHLVRRARISSPVLFTDINRDNFVHEFSHQWWGGLISWESFREQWITEGLAQFSTLIYLESVLSGNGFQRVLNAVRKSVLQHAHTGPMVYGMRIYNLSRERDSFQSVVYNKSALMFMMLREILGEEEFFSRLKRLTEEKRYENLSSFGFIKAFSGESSLLQKFFNGWVHSRRIPVLRHSMTIRGNSLSLRLRQEDTDFVFPLLLRLKTTEGRRRRVIIVEQKDQPMELKEDAVILEAELDALYAPVRLQANS